MSQRTPQFIQIEKLPNSVALITFNRPEVRNALHLPMNLEIRAALDALANDSDVSALVFQGAGGKAFVSGADIAELRDRKGPEAMEMHNARLCDDIAAFPYPTIAAVEGWALGGGCEIAIACDMRVAGEKAKFGQPEVSLGILPAAGGTWRLPRLVGLAKAKELIFTAAIINAEEALGLGLVNHLVPSGQALERSVELAEACAKQSRNAVRLAKAAIEGSLPPATSDLEAVGQTQLYDDPEKWKRMTAFLERRNKKRSGESS
jgi:enoyl-CoA hydratase/carnithine racemase